MRNILLLVGLLGAWPMLTLGGRGGGGIIYTILHTKNLLATEPLSMELCDKTHGFIRRQRKLCRQHYSLMEGVVRGFIMGLKECQWQFRRHRWNCTGAEVPIKNKGKRTRTYMDRLISRGTKESGYVLSITSATVSHAITKACSSGVHDNCGCDRTTYEHPQAPNFKWSGCSDNVHFGAAFTRQFMDVREKRRVRKKNQKLGLTNLHNNNVGRQSVIDKMEVQCKCHGVSGSCELRTCWRALPKVRAVGTFLRERFNDALEVDYVGNRLIPKYQNSRMFSHTDIIYLRPSPNYCERDPRMGSLGTVGRKCNESSLDIDSCDTVCCRRGYQTFTYVKTENCECRFQWCCEVRCKTCHKTVKESTCK